MKNPFFIATTQRAGGFFLMSLLNSTEQVGYLHEYLFHLHEGWEREVPPTDQEVIEHFEQFYEEAKGGSLYNENYTGHWGSKVDIRELRVAEQWMRATDVDPCSIKWIWLRRKNKLRQALSHLKAIETGIWHLDKTDPQEKKDKARAEIDMPIEELKRSAILLWAGDEAWFHYFRENNITPHILFYEDFANESTWKSMVQDIFDHINLECGDFSVSTHRLKQSKGGVPYSYNEVVEDLVMYNIPIELIEIDKGVVYELDLETF